MPRPLMIIVMAVLGLLLLSVVGISGLRWAVYQDRISSRLDRIKPPATSLEIKKIFSDNYQIAFKPFSGNLYSGTYIIGGNAQVAFRGYVSNNSWFSGPEVCELYFDANGILAAVYYSASDNHWVPKWQHFKVP